MSRTVYVGRLPRADVEDHFKGLGRIKEVRLMSNFGFVEFESPDHSVCISNVSVIEYPSMADAEDAIRRLDGTEIHGVPVKLEIQVSSAYVRPDTPQEGGGRESWDRPPPRDYGRRYDGRDSYRPRERSRERPRYDRRDSRRDERYEPRYDDRRPRDDRYDDRNRERSPRRDRDSPRRRDSPRLDRDSPPRDRDGSPPQ
ncbi:mRNA binding protein [Trichosporon asahii var. asahii CBS 8904]|uniref:mRNA binding protein n=2 Tax=Trichosporon asahii var. asahii TaxID=189963 RepID=K1VQW6_TRIAC|nr:mRNA binding protein [Trichosporon asahii var. asahii CBS 2479]EJT50664.1 mRNA binding protein [Trichosporon asahii var. asahii CBS 2479]EKD01827.1 mRNA binding protein [Trichosporon asahii var. asahii CBS 8904]